MITTAAVPGKKAPMLITAEMVAAHGARSVIVDMAAERGGNCELTGPAKQSCDNGVTIIGPAELPATVPYHASQMYARNVATFLKNLMQGRAAQHRSRRRDHARDAGDARRRGGASASARRCLALAAAASNANGEL